MDLFEQAEGRLRNHLPQDGLVHYYGPILSFSEADQYLQLLFEKIAWKRDRVLIRGNKITTRRKVAWYADAPFQYTYSNTTKTALPWTQDLLDLKQRVELHTQEQFNSCLLNLYHDGLDGMAWHSDDERDLKKQGAIASLTLGAERKFSFRHKQTRQTISLDLEHGSVMVMKGEIQSHWLHCLPISKKNLPARINLTFRQIESHL